MGKIAISDLQIHRQMARSRHPGEAPGAFLEDDVV
jgi:hypothetical protein